MTRRLVLAGVGHAQLDLLAALRRRTPAGWQVTVVTSQPDFHYSGMLPAIIAGHVDAAQAAIPVARIARAGGMEVREARVVALDLAARQLSLSDGATVPYDLLSLDVGSVPGALDVPGVAAHAFPMRPFAAALALMQRLDAVIAASPEHAVVPVIVVGAGAAGVEIALALRARIVRARRRPQVTIVDPSVVDGMPLAGFARSARVRAAQALAARAVVLQAGTVTAVEADAVVLATGGREERLPSRATAWVTGPAAAPWLAMAGAPCDARGYPLVDERLALTPDHSAFGGGDCVALRHAPNTPKAGVYAVRMAPILAANVGAVMAGRTPSRRYAPQPDFLALLSTSDGRALLRWRGLSVEGRWPQYLKDWIDERYLRRYRALDG